MKTTIALLLAGLSAHAIPITHTTTISVQQSEWSAPYQGTIVFDLIWGPDATQSPWSTTSFPGSSPGRVTEMRSKDFGDQMFLAFVTPIGGTTHEWHLFLPFGQGKSLTELAGLPRSVEYHGFPYVRSLDAEPLVGEPYGGRFTLVSQPNGAFSVPEEASTGGLLLLGLVGISALRHVRRSW